MASRLLELTATVAREIWDGGRAAGLHLVCKGHSRRINFQGFGTLYTSIFIKGLFPNVWFDMKGFRSEVKAENNVKLDTWKPFLWGLSTILGASDKEH